MKCLLLILFLLPVVLRGQVITTVAGGGTQAGPPWGDGGAAINARLDQPSDIAIDDDNNIYISDPPLDRIRKVNTSGIIETIVGTGNPGYSGDGGPATQASFNFNQNVTIDKRGNLYINDVTSHVIRKIDSTGIISTYAGNGNAGYSGDNGPAILANLHSPGGVATDNIGNLYIADDSNHRVRKVDTLGIITTIAGNGTLGFSGDGGSATSAQLYLPEYVYADNNGNVFISDWGNVRIRKVNSLGIISTVAGNGNYIYSGDGGPAILAGMSPLGFVVDSIGSIYFADILNNRIRKIDTFGIISTIAGNGQLGFNGDSIQATSAKLYYPISVKLDHCGNMYIVDQDNRRIRKVTFNPNCMLGVKNTKLEENKINISPNPAQNEISITGLGNTKDIAIINAVGQTVMTQSSNGNKAVLNAQGLQGGVYFVVLKAVNGAKIVKKIIKE